MPRNSEGARQKWFKFRALWFWRHVHDCIWREENHVCPRVAGNWSCSCNIDSRHGIVKSSWKYRLLCCCVTRDVTQSNGLQEGSFIFLFSVSCFDEEVIFFIFWGLFREKQNHTITEECPDCCLAKHEGNQMSGLGEDTVPKIKISTTLFVADERRCVLDRFRFRPVCCGFRVYCSNKPTRHGVRRRMPSRRIAGSSRGEERRRTTRRRDGQSSGPCASGAFFFRPRTSKKRLQKLEHTGMWLPGKRN